MKNGNLDESKIDLRDLTDDAKEYLNLRVQVIRLNITEKIATALANFISTGAVVIFVLLFFVFAAIGVAYWLGNYFNNIALGFVSVAVFFILIALLLKLISKRSVKPGLTNMFIKDFNNDDD